MNSPSHEDEFVVFDGEEEEECFREPQADSQRSSDPCHLHPYGWKVLIVDDEPDVHRATQLALKRFQFEGRPLLFFSAYSAEEGKQLIRTHQADLALILLDVVMETNDAGLRLVQYIRHELKNQKVRIILRTGHPGEAPEESVILDYDINDYKFKVELTRQRLLTTVVAALRSYRDITTIDQQRLALNQTLEQLQQAQAELEKYMHTLEGMVAERTAALSEANQKLQRLATLDSLTLVANRHRFDEYWQQQWSLLTRHQQPLALVLVDVDFFKQYNDHYGHQAGDECLQQIARCLESTVQRPSDLVARYGGEEFVVLLPYTNLKGATRLAQTMLEAIYRLALPHARSAVCDRITISLGIAALVPQVNLSFDTLITRADKALYQAKQEGRNRYCAYQPTHETV